MGNRTDLREIEGRKGDERAPHVFRSLARAERGRLLVKVHLQPVRGTRCTLYTSSHTACGALKWFRDVMMPADLVKRVFGGGQRERLGGGREGRFETRGMVLRGE